MVGKHTLGVDVSSYQGTDMSAYKRLGAKYVITKVTQGTTYVNPYAQGQIKSTKHNGMVPMAYFYATFGSSSANATTEAKFAIHYAKVYGIPKGSYLAVDWETGSGNVTSGYTMSNTQAITAAMHEIKSAGYKPLLYSGESLILNAVDSNLIVKEFGKCLWVAKYPTMTGVSSPLWQWQPHLHGMAIWQFTSNWHGMSVDANVTMVNLSKVSSKGSDFEMSLHPVVRYDKQGVAVVRNKHFAYLYSDSNLKKQVGKRKRGASFITYGAKDGAVKVGKDQWFDGRAVVYFVNPISTNSDKAGICKVLKGTHAFKHADSSSTKKRWLPVDTKLKFDKRSGKWLHTSAGWVSGLRAYVVL